MDCISFFLDAVGAVAEVETLIVAVLAEVEVEGEREVREEVVTEIVGATSSSLDTMGGSTATFTGGLRFFLRTALCLLPGIVTETRERPKSSRSCNLEVKYGRFHTCDVMYVTLVAYINVEFHWSVRPLMSHCRQHQRIFRKYSTSFYLCSIQSIAADLSTG